MSTSRQRGIRTGRRSHYNLSASTTDRNSCWAPAWSSGETVFRCWSDRRRRISLPLAARRPVRTADADRVHLGETTPTKVFQISESEDKMCNV